jgi:hypothetical protein
MPSVGRIFKLTAFASVAGQLTQNGVPNRIQMGNLLRRKSVICAGDCRTEEGVGNANFG